VPLGPTPQEAVQRATFIIQHPQSEHLQYAIMRDGALATKLQQADPFTFGIEIAKLAAAHETNGQESRTQQAPPPAPYVPVSGGSATTQPSPAEMVKKGGHDFDSSGWREKRAAQRGVKPRFR
jgi:hypothetical protein